MGVSKIIPKESVQSGKEEGLTEPWRTVALHLPHTFLLYYVNSAFKWATPDSKCCVSLGILFAAQAN